MYKLLFIGGGVYCAWMFLQVFVAGDMEDMRKDYQPKHPNETDLAGVAFLYALGAGICFWIGFS